MNTLNVFDAYGHIRDLSGDATVAEIERLDDTTRATLFECVAAVKASADQQEKIRVQRGEVRRLEVIYNAALAADQAANKPTTHHEALAAVVAANAGQKRKRVTQDKQTRGALNEATTLLADARAVLNQVTHALPALQRAESAAILLWRNCLTTPDRLAVVRDYQQRSQDEKIARVKNGQPAITAPVVPPHRSPIDARFANRGKVENRLPAYMGKR